MKTLYSYQNKMLSEDQIYDIKRDVAISDQLENGIDLNFFMNTPIADIVDPDIYYKRESKERWILSFLSILERDDFYNYDNDRKQRWFA